MNDSAIARTMSLLAVLAGSWRGTGRGEYPTIENFRYDERLRFEVDSSYPLIHYEQRTRLSPRGDASHWESGFIRPVAGGSVEISNSQDSGRVEVLRGRATSDGRSGLSLRLELDSVVLDHDPRLHRTRRLLTVHGDTLVYEVMMATHTTPRPRLQGHLRAALQRGTDDGTT